MIININQRKISFGDKYDIYVNKHLNFSAKGKVFRLLAEIDLTDIHSDVVVYTIKRKFSWIRAKYELKDELDRVYELKTESVIKGHFSCDFNQDRYELFRHKGRKCSIYKNEEQIGWWDKKAVTWLNGDNYTITTNDDINLPLVIALCIAMDNFLTAGNKGTFNVDIGKLNSGVKPFNELWEPNLNNRTRIF